MPDEITQVMINHCSPVLLGCKPAALFMLRSERSLAILTGVLPSRLDLMILRKNGSRLLVLVFEKRRLERTLLHKDTAVFLAGMGYPRETSLLALLDCLRRQFFRHGFPHEIGIFLGYPAEDVLGFVRHKGQNYKLSGYWKVYGDVEHAKKCFRQYDQCRECFRALLPAIPPDH